MIEPYFSNQFDFFKVFKTLTYSKMMNRRQYAIFNRPMCEMDFSSKINLYNILFNNRNKKNCKLL